jgi:hypothetical protein
MLSKAASASSVAPILVVLWGGENWGGPGGDVPRRARLRCGRDSERYRYGNRFERPTSCAAIQDINGAIEYSSSPPPETPSIRRSQAHPRHVGSLLKRCQ